jgi:hypothetical protein
MCHREQIVAIHIFDEIAIEFPLATTQATRDECSNMTEGS